MTMLRALAVQCFFFAFMHVVATTSAANQRSSRSSVLAHKEAVVSHALLNNYDVKVAPEYPETTFVNVTIYPSTLRYVNEREETFLKHSYVDVAWHDERLKPNATNKTIDGVCVTAPVPMSFSQIWAPSITLKEATYRTQTPFLNQPYVTVDCEGNVKLTVRPVDETYCKLHMRYFPFDQQNCLFTLISDAGVQLRNHLYRENFEDIVDEVRRYSHDSGSWQLHSSRNAINLAFNGVSGEVVVLNGLVEYSTLIYKFYLTRKPLQYVIDWVVPPILLGSSGVVTMFLGCDVSERHSFGGTIVVTLTLMLSSLREHMAVADDGYPILAQLYMGLMAITMAATSLATFPRYVASRLPTKQVNTTLRLSKKKLNELILTEKQLDIIAMLTFVALLCILVVYAIICWNQREIV